MSLTVSLTALASVKDDTARSVLIDVAICSSLGVVDWMTTYIIGSSLTLFLRSHLGYSVDEASIAYTIWYGSVCLVSVIGGFYSNVYGQIKSIMTFVVLLAVACIWLTSMAFFYDYSAISINLTGFEVAFWIAMLLQVIGNGGIRTTAAAFGDEQVKAMDDFTHNPMDSAWSHISMHSLLSEQEQSEAVSLVQKLKKSYWSLYYMELYVGIILGVVVGSYLCQEVSFSAGWSVAAVCVTMGAMLFLWRSGDFYTERQSEPDPETPAIYLFASIIWYAITNRGIHTSDTPGNIHWLDIAKEENEGPFEGDLVEEVKAVLSICAFVPFQAVYFTGFGCSGSLFYSQGCQMNYYTNGVEIPIGLVAASEMVPVLLLLPVVDQVLYPWLDRINLLPTSMQRVRIAFISMILCVSFGGLVEIWRKETTTTNIQSTCNSDIYLSELSLLWQIPQYAMVGIATMFMGPTMTAFYSSNAPPNMRSIMVSLYFVAYGIGYYLNTILVAIADMWSPEWIPSDLDDGHLEYFLFSVAGLLLLTLIIFIPFSRRFEFEPDPDRIDDVVDFEYVSLEAPQPPSNVD